MKTIARENDKVLYDVTITVILIMPSIIEHFTMSVVISIHIKVVLRTFSDLFLSGEEKHDIVSYLGVLAIFFFCNMIKKILSLSLNYISQGQISTHSLVSLHFPNEQILNIVTE